MCGPAGTMGCLGMSVFGALFMAAMATLISRDYQYLGEWYTTAEADHASYEVQKANAAHNCWLVSGIYGSLALVCALGTCYHSIKAKRS